MLEDRYYMRQERFDPRRSATLMLVIANAVVFVVQSLIERSPTLADYYYYYGALSLEGLKHGFVWQLLTYQFMHAGLLHIVCNCWAIYVFGLAVESALGRKQFLTLYFASGVIGGLVQVLADFLPFGSFGGPVVGASAAGFGLVAAFAMLFPDRVLLLFFIIPVRAKWLLLLCGGLALAGIVVPPGNAPGAVHVADAAHLGGMLTGILFIRYALQWDWHWPKFRRAQPSPVRRLARVPSPKASFWAKAKSAPEEELAPEDFLSKEVDPILDKITAHGIQSLTERERRILEAARERMAKR
jgi:membrane associated rhomboid family serine protease